MTSDEARDRFGDALEGALAEAERAAFDAALAADEGLREEWEAYRALVKGAHALGARDEGEPGPGEEPAPDLLRGVQARLRARSRGRFYRDRFSEREGGGRGTTTLLLAMLVLLVAATALVVLSELVVVELPRPAPAPDDAAEGS